MTANKRSTNLVCTAMHKKSRKASQTKTVPAVFRCNMAILHQKERAITPKTVQLGHMTPDSKAIFLFAQLVVSDILTIYQQFAINPAIDTLETE